MPIASFRTLIAFPLARSFAVVYTTYRRCSCTRPVDNHRIVATVWRSAVTDYSRKSLVLLARNVRLLDEDHSPTVRHVYAFAEALFCGYSDALPFHTVSKIAPFAWTDRTRNQSTVECVGENLCGVSVPTEHQDRRITGVSSTICLTASISLW